MRRRFRIFAFMTAWILASGIQWDCAQVAGWARMFSIYSRSMPLSEAARLTFTPGNLCGVCKAVGSAKRADGGFSTVEGKFGAGLAFLVPDGILDTCRIREPDKKEIRRPTDDVWSDKKREAPPVPPPRSLAV